MDATEHNSARERVRGWAARSVQLASKAMNYKAAPATPYTQARRALEELTRRRESSPPKKFKKLATLLVYAQARALEGYHGESSLVLAHMSEEQRTTQVRELLDEQLQSDLATYTAQTLQDLRRIVQRRALGESIAARMYAVAGPDDGEENGVQILARNQGDLVLEVLSSVDRYIVELENETTLKPDDRRRLRVRSVLGFSPDELERHMVRDMFALKRAGVSYSELGFIFYPDSRDREDAKEAARKRLRRYLQRAGGGPSKDAPSGESASTEGASLDKTS